MWSSAWRKPEPLYHRARVSIPNAKFVHLDTKPHVLMGNSRSSDVYIQTDAKLGVEALEAALAKQSFNRQAIARLKKKKLVGHFQDRAEFPIEDGNVDPREVVTTLDETVPEKSVC